MPATFASEKRSPSPPRTQTPEASSPAANRCESTSYASSTPSHTRPCPDGSIGEIWVRGPSIGVGYWGREALTNESFNAKIVGGRDGYFRTGDTGFIHEGSLYVCGRLYDELHIDGLVHQPHDLERDAEEVAGAPGCAFQRDDRVYLAVESRRSRSKAEFEEIADKVAERISRSHGLAVEVVLIPPRSILKTSSGKIRRHAYHDAHAMDELEILHTRPSSDR